MKRVKGVLLVIRKIFNAVVAFFMLLLLIPMFVACKEKQAQIELPNNISLTSEENEPVLKVYDTKTESIITMQLEEYLKGVLAGEMFNDWHIEALKAQAILARTYTLYFLQNLTSKYEGADISNDVTEAQAYDAERINENIIKAVEETKGLVILNNGNLIETWFHSNSGGTTTTAKNGLNFLGEEDYTQQTSSPETAENSENYEWTATFTKSEVLSALREMGVSVSTIKNFVIGEKDESGRALTFKVGETEFSASTFRLKLGSTKMKSTMLTNIVVSTNSINLTGRGYGHGVGMSQWGAKIMAENEKTAEEIIMHYFKNIEICEAKYE